MGVSGSYLFCAREEKVMATRLVCKSCNQELGRSSFYRHLTDDSGSVCPGKVTHAELSQSSDEESSEEQPEIHSPDMDAYNAELDTTFKVSPAREDVENAAEERESTYHSTISDCESVSSVSSSFDTESSGDEVMIESDSESEEDEGNLDEGNAANIISGIILFFNFFHLGYKLSERAIIVLMNFVKTLFIYIATIIQNPLLKKVADNLPSTLYKLKKHFHQSCEYDYFVVCPKCFSLYQMEVCIIKIPGHEVQSKVCDHVEFPHHPHSSRRVSCGAVLMKKIKIGEKYKLVPKKTFVYRSIIQSLKEMSRRKGFLQLFRHWSERDMTGDILGDIYDGQVWRDATDSDGRPFFSVPNNLGLALNIDWFNLYEDTQYSVGAIYLSILNLPRSDRFKYENIILVGIIPGPKEPDNLNHFLTPLVKELQILYDGVTFRNSSSLLSVTSIRAILLAIICDLPATRKVCGFTNFNGLKGCSKCLKEFPTEHFGEKPNYGGFNTDRWIPRDFGVQRSKAFEAKIAHTASERKNIERSHGVKYSKLLDLSYLNIVRCHVIDPMHNLFLGLAKHAFKTWKELQILPHCLECIQEKVDLLIPPPKVGRIPRKITSGFASLTADEWKNWVLFYPLYSLHGVLPTSHYKCWAKFVDSCRILTLPVINIEEVKEGSALLLEYCKQFQELYGSERVTPNMHMACHLMDCMLDYGPLSSFWCFAFERYNGILEGIQISWNSPEKQIFIKFLGMQHVSRLQGEIINENESDDFLATICKNSLLIKQDNINLNSVNRSAQSDVIICQQIQNFVE